MTTGSPLQYESNWWTTLAWSTSFALALFGVCFLLGGFLLLKYWLNFRDLKAAQKGSARFTTFQELKQQYRDVPDRKKTYSGSGGVPVGRYRARLPIFSVKVLELCVGLDNEVEADVPTETAGDDVRHPVNRRHVPEFVEQEDNLAFTTSARRLRGDASEGGIDLFDVQ